MPTKHDQEVRSAYRRGLEDATFDAVEVVQRSLDHYPEDLFPPDGESLDCKSAKWARNLLGGIIRDIKEND